MLEWTMPPAPNLPLAFTPHPRFPASPPVGSICLCLIALPSPESPPLPQVVPLFSGTKQTEQKVEHWFLLLFFKNLIAFPLFY